MVGRKWEDLDMDCLVNIFGRVDVVILVLNVQYVCKSWYKATCIPQCWSILDFTEGLSVHSSDFDDESTCVLFGPFIYEDSARFADKYYLKTVDSLNGFFKFVAKRGNVYVTHLKKPAMCTQEAINFMANQCPNIKSLELPEDSGDGLESVLPSLVSKWKKLEYLSFPCGDDAREVFVQLGLHCKNLEILEILNGRIGEDDTSALVTYLPNLKGLSMISTEITKKNLLTILKSCRTLDFLDASYCVGFDENDSDILNASAHIRFVKLEGSRFYMDHVEDYYHYSEYCDFEEGYD